MYKEETWGRTLFKFDVEPERNHICEEEFYIRHKTCWSNSKLYCWGKKEKTNTRNLRRNRHVKAVRWQERWWQVQSDESDHGGMWQSLRRSAASGDIDSCERGGIEVKLAWCQGAPVLLLGLWYTPFNITALHICQWEPGRRAVNCYFKLSAWICVTQCLVGLFCLWHKKEKKCVCRWHTRRGHTDRQIRHY